MVWRICASCKKDQILAIRAAELVTCRLLSVGSAHRGEGAPRALVTNRERPKRNTDAQLLRGLLALVQIGLIGQLKTIFERGSRAPSQLTQTADIEQFAV